MHICTLQFVYCDKVLDGDCRKGLDVDAFDHEVPVIGDEHHVSLQSPMSVSLLRSRQVRKRRLNDGIVVRAFIETFVMDAVNLYSLEGLYHKRSRFHRHSFLDESDGSSTFLTPQLLLILVVDTCQSVAVLTPVRSVTPGTFLSRQAPLKPLQLIYNCQGQNLSGMVQINRLCDQPTCKWNDDVISFELHQFIHKSQIVNKGVRVNDQIQRLHTYLVQFRTAHRLK